MCFSRVSKVDVLDVGGGFRLDVQLPTATRRRHFAAFHVRVLLLLLLLLLEVVLLFLLLDRGQLGGHEGFDGTDQGGELIGISGNQIGQETLAGRVGH